MKTKPRLNDWLAMPCLNPMSESWADIIWANNPETVRVGTNLHDWDYWKTIRRNNPCNDYRFKQFQR